MKYFSTRNKNNFVSFREAVIKGLAQDGGLFIPEIIPTFQKSFFENLNSITFQEIGFETAKKFIGDEIDKDALQDIIEKSLKFSVPVLKLSNQINVLELFHGPTLAFKDFGAQFMARTMEYFVKDNDREPVILVATSGDTGSAVANAFYDIEGIKVHLLYPGNKVSYIQEMQLTTLDKNVTALEVKGTFDDCQNLVKNAFSDIDLKAKLNLTSANSINIARLIPQSFYYINAYKQLELTDGNLIFSVPSGNLGNLTAGLIAKKMGLPIDLFIAATNSNDVFTNYLHSGKFEPCKSIQTYSNAMDVGNPSNLERIRSIYNNDIQSMKKDIDSYSFNDEETVTGMKEVYEKYKYIIDPHGAVGYLALKKYLSNQISGKIQSVIVETAHPAKFKDIVEKSINDKIEMPARLAECLKKEKSSIALDNNFESFKDYLINSF